MPRAKQYNEAEVIEKAMSLFWQKGYENTSVRMLEKEMGINQFSIYSSFGSKHGVFLESLKCYRVKMKQIFDTLQNSDNGVADIKQFFYDSIEISQEEGYQKGCLFTKTYNEFSNIEDDQIHEMMNDFMSKLKQIFIQKLRKNSSKSEAEILQQANYILLAKHGLASAERVNTAQEIKDYIEMVFTKV